MEKNLVGRLKDLFGNKVSNKEIKIQTGDMAASIIVVLEAPEETYIAYMNDSFQRGAKVFSLIGVNDARFDKARKIMGIMCQDFGFTEYIKDFKVEDLDPSKFKAFISVADMREKKG